MFQREDANEVESFSWHLVPLFVRGAALLLYLS